MNHNDNKTDLKKFFIKLIAVIFAIIVVINVSYNLIIAGQLENLAGKENIKQIESAIKAVGSFSSNLNRPILSSGVM